MRTGPVFAFESIGEDLPFLPLAARRLLDSLGRKMSLEAWVAMPLADRKKLVALGSEGRIDPAALPIIEAARPAPVSTSPVPDPDPSSPPPSLVAALGALTPPRTLDDALWQTLLPLARYALVKSAAKPDKLGRACDELLGPHLTHLNRAGEAHMVHVGEKAETARRAVASARVRTTPATMEAIATRSLTKGDVLAVARVAGIQAAKRTPELVPLCHPVRTTGATVDFELGLDEVRVRATVEAVDRTGVEMEAMVAASVASLTVYDMIKSADRWATIEDVRLEAKSGGKSGQVTRPEARAPRVALRTDPLSVDEAVAHVKHAGAGAVCVFLGNVRDHNEGRSVEKLEYEAYPSMALAEMTRIVAELEAEMPAVRLSVLHRSGPLVVGDVAVVCAASAAHRGEAFAACRALIDRVKARVPIWKREHGPGGATWVGWEDARCVDEGHDHAHDDHR